MSEGVVPRAAPKRPLRARAASLGRTLSPLLPFAATAVLYELFRSIFQQHGAVHVGDLRALEQRFFSIRTPQGLRTIGELLAQHHNAWLDAWCGVTYLLFLPQILAATVFLSRRWRSRAWQLSLGFLLANLLGWLIWIVYPAAPPWYADSFGLHPAMTNVAASAAGLVRFDALVGLPLASTFYAQSANVFGAMPSLHVAYPTLVVCAVAPLGEWPLVAALAFALSIAFSAVYLRHHYVLDVLAGILLALGTWAAIRGLCRIAFERQPTLPFAQTDGSERP